MMPTGWNQDAKTSSRGTRREDTGCERPQSQTKDTCASTGGSNAHVPLLGTPCFGKWALFDSTELGDHIEARALCARCPIIVKCVTYLAEIQRTSGSYGQPEGTWAGTLLTGAPQPGRLSRDDRLREKYDAEEAAYTEEQARQANLDYERGDRGPWATTGHRVHQRRKRRLARKKVA